MAAWREVNKRKKGQPWPNWVWVALILGELIVALLALKLS